VSAVVSSISGNPRLRISRLVKLLVARQRLAAGIAAEARHLMDPAETAVEAAFDRLCCAHPETCSCAADYPGWKPGDAR
jgi:hypothetical protein